MADQTFQPLARRLLVGVVLWSLLATLLLAAVQGWREFRTVQAQTSTEIEVLSTVLARQVAGPVWEVSAHLAEPILEAAFKQHPAVSRIELWDLRSNGPVAALDRTDTVRAVPAEFPVLRENRPIGRVVVYPDAGHATRAAVRAAVDVALIGLVAAVLPLAIFGWQLRRHLQHPLRQLSDFLDALQADRPDARLVLDRPRSRHRDEFDRLVTAFSSLQGRMAEHIKGLDAKVAERTEALQQAHDTLKTLATTDVLTGCHNRFAFSERFPEVLQRCRRYGRPLSVVFVDIDHFKSVNDRHGHAVGDQVLAAVGACLREALRGGSDWVARYGGEEFVVVLEETPLAEALEVAERLRCRIADTVRIQGAGAQAALAVTASMGLAELRADDSLESLLERADACLYAAKREGRNRVVSAALSLA